MPSRGSSGTPGRRAWKPLPGVGADSPRSLRVKEWTTAMAGRGRAGSLPPPLRGGVSRPPPRAIRCGLRPALTRRPAASAQLRSSPPFGGCGASSAPPPRLDGGRRRRGLGACARCGGRETRSRWRGRAERCAVDGGKEDSVKGIQEGFLTRGINPPRRQIAAIGRNLPQLVEPPNGFSTS